MRYAVCSLLVAAIFNFSATPAHAAGSSNLPLAVQSVVDSTLHTRWPQGLAYAPVTAVRTEKVSESANIYLVQINYQGFMILTEKQEPGQAAQVRMVAYGQSGGEDLYPQDGALQDWLHALAQQLKAVPGKSNKALPPPKVGARADDAVMAFDAPQPGFAASVAPLTTSIWGQSGAYNDRTPPDGSTVPTGCVATALAQAMRYFQHPIEPKKGVISYTHKTTTADGAPFSYGVLSADLSQVRYTWENMPDKVTAANSQVADLMYHLGISLYMRYRPGFSSNAYFDDIPPAMRNNFAYDISDQLFRSSYTAEQWQSKIQTELQAQRVVVMCGYDYNAGAGHCWVVDGYDDKNFFHMNWGWDGRFNGYFSLNEPAVMGYDFSGYNHIFTMKPSCYMAASHEVLGANQVRLSNGGFALNNTFAYRRLGDTAWTENNVAQASYVLGGLQANTTYEYKVAAQCSRLGRNESAIARFTTLAAAQQYCASNGASNAYEWIDAVTIAGTQKQSAANAGGYADFSQSAVSVRAGQVISLKLKPGYVAPPAHALYWSVWLDVNNDGVFSADERVFTTRAAGEQNGQITLPANLSLGEHRLRVVMSYYAADSACGQLQYGEVEDYKLGVGQ